MLLLRRREMMENQEQEENVIYIDAGFLDGSVRVDDLPRNNPQYPDAWSTTSFPVSKNDIVKCSDLAQYNSEIRIRQYDSSGGQSNRLDVGQNITILYGMTHARLMYLNKDMKAPIPSDLLVNHADGTSDTYKIIDRR